jgi:hypothetical protein
MSATSTATAPIPYGTLPAANSRSNHPLNATKIPGSGSSASGDSSTAIMESKIIATAAPIATSVHPKTSRSERRSRRRVISAMHPAVRNTSPKKANAPARNIGRGPSARASACAWR